MKRWFNQGPGPGLRAFILLLVSITLMVVDHRVLAFHQTRTKITSLIAYPFQWTVDAPIRLAHWIDSSVTSQQQLVDENEKLRANQLLLESQLQRLMNLQKENAQLRLLLQSTSQVSGRVQVARLLSVNMDPNVLEVTVNRGARDHVYAGQPVLDGYGVIGQVINVSSLTSNILLITDQRSAVPVKDARNGLRAVAQGMGLSGQLMLVNIPDTVDVQVGDVFLTSGLGLHYPVGYPVGQVVSIQKTSDMQQAQQIILAPLAHLDQAELVLLSWPTENGKGES